MKKKVSGSFCTLNGKSYYKIENYDCMDNFFMTITSSSDVWNFCWSKGGITAGRIDSNHAVFPYYTADKVSDATSYTGNFTSIAVKGSNTVWEPFSALRAAPSVQVASNTYLFRNLYKNLNGTEILFEEINTKLQLKFITGWTSSEKYGLVRYSRIENLSDKEIECSVLDGCQNIMPACSTSDFQNTKSVLLDAYKKTDLEENANLALFTLSSIVSDKAEPNEGLYANTCWFSTNDKVILATDAPEQFAVLASVSETSTGKDSKQKLPKYKDFVTTNCLKGQRPSCFICRNLKLKAAAENKGSAAEWYQVFDTALSTSAVISLIKAITNKKAATKDLKNNIDLCDSQMTNFIQAADGIQHTGDEITCLHHRENVMFNIMRGGIILDDGKIDFADFILFAKQRNKKLGDQLEKVLQNKVAGSNKAQNNKALSIPYSQLQALVEGTKNPQFQRLFLEYIPLTFSRRHGDPSRPWNIFSINIKSSDGNPILNYEGNWRDIFQNWEALAYSYPAYIKNMYAKFLNAMTADGYNPYKINRAGIDWEIPDPTNPWAQIGYWGDHQIIYFEKLLELYSQTNYEKLLGDINEKIYTSTNVPYRIASYKKILEDPRNTILFDKELSNSLQQASKKYGSDKKLILDSADLSTGQPYLLTFAAKVMQIVLTKAANFVPGGGIWLNTQRPEWNDANNALAGYGLSVVTLCYLCRFINTLLELFEKSPVKKVTMPKTEIKLLRSVKTIYGQFNDQGLDGKKSPATDPALRKAFVDKLGLAYEKERNELYKNGYGTSNKASGKNKQVQNDSDISTSEIIACLKEIQKQVETTISLNKRKDGLYHSYNTLKISGDKMFVENLNEMLEGQVAVLSSGLLSTKEAAGIIKSLYASKMYEPNQNSFMLYPNKELPKFCEKNCINDDIAGLKKLIDRTGNLYLQKDCNGNWHFNSDFRNADVIKNFIQNQEAKNRPTAAEEKVLLMVYLATLPQFSDFLGCHTTTHTIHYIILVVDVKDIIHSVTF